jgi:hypothetical protein
MKITKKVTKPPRDFQGSNTIFKLFKKSNQVPSVRLEPLSKHMGVPMPPPPCTIVGTHIKSLK